jgi:monovalent cation:H+ antiporter-2, CPA2 family
MNDMHSGWELLPRIVMLLAVAAGAGLLFRRLGQSVIVGYLVAGVLMGPTGVGLVQEAADLQVLAELGVALLLFSIGLEFSLPRLRQLGRVALYGGTIQVIVTAIVFAAGALALGTETKAAIAIGLAFSMSSTAVVLRALTDRAELDSPQGRNATGILLLQDMAVVPLLIAVDALGKNAAAETALSELALRVALVVLFTAVTWALARWVLPRVLRGAAMAGSRDLPVLVALCLSFGAAWSAHSLGFSPALGAFIAGLLLAESPFATQVRADMAPLSAAFVALFFASVGTLAKLSFEPRQLLTILGIAGVVLLVKTGIVTGVVWGFQRSMSTALITGLALSQVGEFTFVLAQTAQADGLLPRSTFHSLVGISLATLVMTPYTIAAGPRLAATLLRRLPTRRRHLVEKPAAGGHDWRRVIVVGFGPAGQEVVRQLMLQKMPFLVLETNPDTVAANRSSVPIELGDATQREVLQHVGIGQSLGIVVTIPDPASARMVLAMAAKLAPSVRRIARSRYHMFADSLQEAGAHVTIDEEHVMGMHLAREVLSTVPQPKRVEQPEEERV